MKREAGALHNSVNKNKPGAAPATVNELRSANCHCVLTWEGADQEIFHS